MVPVERPLASITNRFLALLIDLVLISIPIYIAERLFPVLGSVLVGLLYAPLLESSTLQATVGKYVMGLQVTDLEGRRISLKAAFIRYAVKVFGSAIAFLGYFMAFFTNRKQALHDLVAETLVVYGKSNQDMAQAWMESARSAADLAKGAIESAKSAASSQPQGSHLDQLERLQALRERGALSEEEFQREKSKILG